MKIRKELLLTICALFSLLACPQAQAVERTVTLFAAASLSPVLEELSAHYQKSTSIRCRCTYAASSVLAKQIYNGAPADIFISANPEWMTFLHSKQALVNSSRSDLVGNRLILASRKDSPSALKFDMTLPAMLAQQKLAMGDPDHVPAGIYGKSALVNRGMWASISDNVVRTNNSRVSVALIKRGEVAAGIIYQSDYVSGQEYLKLQDRIPAKAHQPIVYPISVIKGRERPEVRAYLSFLKSPSAMVVFIKHGFILPEISGIN